MAATLRRVGIIAATDLRRRFRSRSAIVMAFIGPIVMAVVFSVLVGGGTLSFRIGVVDGDGSELSRSLVSGLLDAPTDGGPVSFQAVDDEATARDDVDHGDVDAAIVVPAGFADAVRAGQGSTLTVVRSPDRIVSGQVAEAVAARIAARFQLVGLSAATAAAHVQGPPPAAVLEAAQSAAPAISAVEVPDAADLDPAAFFGASMSILFLFFTVGFASQSLIGERRTGTLPRVLATPASPAEVIAGKTFSVALLGLCGFVTVALVTSIGFGAGWGDPGWVLLVMVATVAAVAGVSMFVASLARTEQQAATYTSVVTFVFALAGGNFLGPTNTPEALQRLSRLTPNGWSLRAFTDLAADAATTRSTLTAVIVLAVIAAVFGSVGVARLRRGVRA